MTEKITAEMAQTYVAQHLKDAITSLELAQEYTILPRIIDCSPFSLTGCRRMLVHILEDNGSKLAVEHYRKMVNLTDGFSDINREGIV